ncbi:hypothetical protein Forpe1208_v015343 [Fusarium oxysporum f. sp. rapae]|uniref:Uncharacterized protein n=1 Tax=Fusarium oxysporum f. sp. rapae TaxID=485398 RepID=A0A8J5NIG3_FUSOX|nr:hypothetical protein Forpe1208_v015343 [Fusarium oxysporum f. sp. rapae]
MATPTQLYPGVNLALREMPESEFNFKDEYLFYPIGFPEYTGSESTVMPVKEVVMMILMDVLTDIPDWHKKVFEETIVQKWREEARQQGEDGLYARIMQDKLGEGPRKPRDRIITDAAFDYCIGELRGKARYFAQSGLRSRSFPLEVGMWQLEDQMNEKIAATALYYFDSENVTPSRLSFRMQTSSSLNDGIKAGQDGYNYLGRVYGTDLGTQGGFSRSCVQSYGDVGTPEGRLLAFPTSCKSFPRNNHNLSKIRLVNTVFPLSSDKIRRSRDIDASSPFGWLIHTGESFRRRMCRLSKRIGGLEVVKCLGALWTLRKRGRIG